MGEAAVLFEFDRRPAGIQLGRVLTLYSNDTTRCVFMGPSAVFTYDRGDKAAEAMCIAMVSRLKLATGLDIARAFGVHRNTVARYAREYEASGMQGLIPQRRGPKGPHKVTPAVVDYIAAHPDVGARNLARGIAAKTGIRLSESHVGMLKARHHFDSTATVGEDPQQISADTLLAEAEIEPPDKIQPETCAVANSDPAVTIPDGAQGTGMGAALYYPAVEALGLLEAADEHYQLPQAERFDVRATVLAIFMLTLLGRSTVETAKHISRTSFGATIGTGLGPCVKTLRRKLALMVQQGASVAFGEALARRWVESGVVETAYLYVDGHVKAYTGKRRIDEVWNAQRRMPLPGVMTYFVGDVRGRPLLFVSDEVTGSLAKSLPKIVASVRAVLGERKFTVIFDRGGYDGRLFEWLSSEGIDFITYQRGNPGLSRDEFRRCETRQGGRRVRFYIAEDSTTVNKLGPWRRVVVLTVKDGHQTPILTSIPAERLGSARVAMLMFARWRQENFFKYMREHHELDRIISHAFEDAQTETISNPARIRLQSQMRAKRAEIVQLQAVVADQSSFKPFPASRGAATVEHETSKASLRQARSELEDLRKQLRECPRRVPATEATEARQVLRLEQKTLIDRIKLTAYNAEEWLLERLSRHYRNEHDRRDLLRSFAQLPGVMARTPLGLTVTLDAPDTPIHRRALRGLCEELNTLEPTYPGTSVPVSYRVAMHNSEPDS